MNVWILADSWQQICCRPFCLFMVPLPTRAINQLLHRRARSTPFHWPHLLISITLDFDLGCLRRRSPEMTTYGTIPTSTGPSSSSSATPLDYISRAKERGRSALATRRPWRQLASVHAMGLPPSLGEAYVRIRTNASYFAMNYAIIVLLVVFCSLLWHPISLIVFLACLAAWLFLYFLRDEPLVFFGRTIGDRVVLIVLSVVTLVLLLLTKVTSNVLISLLVGLLLVLIHAVLRKTEDLVMEEEAAGPGKWYAAVS